MAQMPWLWYLLVAVACAALLPSCLAPVSPDFRARLWEKCYIPGQNQIRLEHYKAALTLLQEALRQSDALPVDDDRRLETQLSLSTCLLNTGLIDRAQKSFEGVAGKACLLMAGGNPKFWQLFYGRALVGIGECQTMQQRYPEAIGTFHKAVANLQACRIDEKHGYDVDGLALALAYEGLADCYIASGQPGQSLEPLAEAVHASYWTVALMEFKERIRTKYVSTLWSVGDQQRALANSQESWSEPLKQGLSAWAAGDLELSREAALNTEDLMIGRADQAAARATLNVLLANVAYCKGDYLEVVALTRAGLKLRSTEPTFNTDTVCSDLYQLLGLAEEAQGKLKEAASDLKRALALDQALKLRPATSMAARLAQLATVELKLGNQAAAQEAIVQAGQLLADCRQAGGNSGVACFWIARYYNTCGDRSASGKYAKEALLQLKAQPKHVLIAGSQELCRAAEGTRASN